MIGLRFIAIGFALALQFAAFSQEVQEAAPTTPLPPLKPIEQVQMHVWISETTEQGLRDLGSNLRYTRFIGGVENQTDSLQQVNTQVFDPLNPLFGATLPAPDENLFGAPLRPDQAGSLQDGIQTQSGAGLTFTLFEDRHGTIDGIFRSVEEKADVDLISKPEILVINEKPATIHAGGEVPFQDIKYEKGVPKLNVSFKNIGVNMNVTPSIQPNDYVQLNITSLDVTDLVRIENIRGVELPVISKRSQTGSVKVPNGQVAVIGGLSSRVVRKSERRVPIVGKIPLLGIFFRGRRSEATNTHLIVFVAPTIVDLRELSPTAVNALQFWREGGWKNIKRIEQEIAVMEDE